MSKKKSGVKRTYPLEKLIKLFEKHEEDIILENGKTLRPGDMFWSEFYHIHFTSNYPIQKKTNSRLKCHT